MPPPIKVPCPGCANLFSARRGLFSHLRQTTNPNCKQALQDLQAELRHQPLNHVDEPADMEDETAEGDTVQPQVFAGDFFGDNYSSDDFPGWDDREESDYAGEDESIHPEEYAFLVFLC